MKLIDDAKLQGIKTYGREIEVVNQAENTTEDLLVD